MDAIERDEKLKALKKLIDTMNQIKGGFRWTAGCSDGEICRTYLRCTNADCTADCGTLNACGSTDPTHTQWSCTL